MDLHEWKQMAFNGAYRGLQWQGFEPSVRSASSGCCRLNGYDGKHCTIGWLIPEGTGVSQFDSIGVILMYFIAPDLRADRTYFRSKVRFLTALQRAHDCHPIPSDMKRVLLDFAKVNGLKIPTPWKG